jgi:hemoglobin-like flavoprotein
MFVIHSGPMTERQISIVKNSWKIFQDIDPALIGDVFYSKLFITSPRLKNMFHIPRDEQSKKLVEMLSMIVGRLDRIAEIHEDIRKLAIRHVTYGVKQEHYKSVGDALLWMLEQGLGKDWNDEVKEAWNQCYLELSQTMIDAAGYKSKSS